MNNLIKMGGVAALLVWTLAIPMPSSAFNLVVENTISSSTSLGNATSELGQSFINDPIPPNGSGTGINVFLNSFTFGYRNPSSQTIAAGKTLSIFDGTGNGGTEIASSMSTSTSPVTGISNPVTWTFSSAVQLIETSTYSAVLRVPNGSIIWSVSPDSNPYANGSLTSGTVGGSERDLVFRANFEPVPFEFNPAMGLGILSGVWLLGKRFKKTK